MVDTPQNPFAAPAASLIPSREGEAWHDGRILVVRPGTILPERCVRCGEPAVEMKRRTYYWHHPLIYLLALCALLLYALVAIIVRKRAQVTVGLCAAHRRKRVNGILTGWGGSLAGIVLAFIGGANDNCGVMAAGALLMLASIIAGMFMARVLYPERIDRDFARLKGAGEAFLAGLPGFNG